MPIRLPLTRPCGGDDDATGMMETMSAAKKTVRTRLMMAGAFVGALVALSLSWSFSWGSASDSPEQQARNAAFHASPGECLIWKKDPAAEPRTVSCKKAHLFEVTGVVNLSSQFPSDAPPPDVDKWRDVADKHCSKNIDDYLDEPLDPNGRYSLTVLRPTSQDWKDGLRKVRCGLQRTGPRGKPLSSTGHAAEQDQSSVYDAGTCLALADKSAGRPTGCAKEHSYEIVATLDLTKEFSFTDGYPDSDDQNEWLDKQCNKKLDDYTGDDDLDDDMMLGWDTVKEDSWEAGSTRVNCKVGKTLDDGSGLAATTGSIAKDARASKDGKETSTPTSTSGSK